MEVVPLVIPVGTLTRSESMSEESGLAIEISHALGESLSDIREQYFGGSDESDRVELRLAEERDCLQEDLLEQERFDEKIRRGREDELRSYHKDNTF
jgi:hypothetical protein